MSGSGVTPHVSPFVTEAIPGPGETLTNPFKYYAFDLLTGAFLAQLPLREVMFGQILNQSGKLSGKLDLSDPRVLKADPVQHTSPNRTLIVVDYNGRPMWGGIVLPRKWDIEGSISGTSRILEVNCSETWSWFGSRVQATDYSSPPYSGITGGPTGIARPMTYWTGTPFDATLIATQIVADAIGFEDSVSEPFGNILGGLQILVNNRLPSVPLSESFNWIAVNYPYPSLQYVSSIVQQLSELGLGVGFDFALDLAYSEAPPSPIRGTVAFSYPRRGRRTEENDLTIDLGSVRKYSFPEDGAQTANTVYETGGSGAISVAQNVTPLDQGYPLWEKVVSRGSIQSQHIVEILQLLGLSDLALYSYPPVTPSVTLGLLHKPQMPIGSFMVGDDVQVLMPKLDGDGHVFDPRFPDGMEQAWRITGWTANVKDEGDPLLELDLAPPPLVEVTSPTI